MSDASGQCPQTVAGRGLAWVVWLTTAWAMGDCCGAPTEPLAAALGRHCGACHCEGAAEGGVNLEAMLEACAGWPLDAACGDHDAWLAVWRTLRSGAMPPAGEPRPPEPERRGLVAAIERDVFGVDGASPDPGRVVLRRLNRVEYANTVRDLTGLDPDVIDDLPADDTGHGFDTIAEVLTVSPLLLEKYLAAAARVGAPVGEACVVAVADGPPAYPPAYRTVFAFGPPPADPAAAADHRRRTIVRLATRGFRRPPDTATVDRLTAVAAGVEGEGGTFEQGMAAVVTALVSSPRFLFRFEDDAPGDATSAAVPIDEFSLATRLSYFLWSTMPDDELLALASAGGLRAQLPDVVERMIRDPRGDAFISNFVGQWLRTRDIETLPFSLKRIVGLAESQDQKRVKRHFDEKLRPAMRRESEMLVAHVLRAGLPATDLLLGRSTFLNADLAAHYGVPGVEGDAMRLVELPAGTRQGGLLAHASILAVTSTPTRTSPVKRGMFVLDALLGVPPPPTPPAVPSLEAAEQRAGKDASVRELLEAHRADEACAACHALMDPVGLALEEYDAIGRWRGEAAAVAGTLLTGETFADTAELATRIAVDGRRDFHRCLVEKLLTYAIGRGLEVHDAPAVERIVAGLEAEGRFADAIHGVVASVPFQMRRRDMSDSESHPTDADLTAQDRLLPTQVRR